MGPDPAKRFMKKNGDRIPGGEQVQAVLIAEAKGGAWRRGMAAAGPATATIGHDAKEKARAEQTAASAGGDAAQWPAASMFWLVLTDKQLHVFEGRTNSSDVAGSQSYPRERIASIDLDKKLLISKLNVAFRDGSSVELDVAKQKTGPFVDAIRAGA
ncbi:MAG TPA: hypothetical protein VEV43_03900 [Actinomycetota bacterium]|nr:hypothetical protein [Actinomycetota bacterium]